MITRRTFLQLSAATFPSAGLSATQPPAPSPPPVGLPNIVFFLADQMTPFMTGPYGQKVARTPNMDRLAAGGTLFENAYCNSPLCVPSRVSLFTGRLPAEVGAFDNASEFAAHRPTLMHYLRRAGYRTVVAGKCHFIGPDQLHGFEERLTPCIFPAGYNMLPDWKLGPILNKGTSVQSLLRALGPSTTNRQIAFDDMVFNKSLERLRQHAAGGGQQPLFLNISLTHPHDPFTTTQEYLDLYKDAAIPLPKDHGDIRRLSPTYEWFVIHHGLHLETIPPSRILEARRNYLGMISWVDNKLGQLLQELQQLGMANNTIVVFASDHGEMMGEHGQWSKRLMLEWSSRVPFIIHAPGRIAAGNRVKAPVSLVDLFPTLCEVAGTKVETPLDGRSLIPLIEGRDSGRDRAVIAEYLGEGALEPIRMVRAGSLKYITVNNHAPQLFNLEKDPEESENLAGTREYAEAEKDLRKRAESGWDGNALKKAVLASQQERSIVRSMTQFGTAPDWNYAGGPFRD